MAGNQIHLLLLALPLFLFSSDIYNIVLRALSPPPNHHHKNHHHNPHLHDNIASPQSPPKFFGRPGELDPISLGGKFHVSFCTSCSYKKTAVKTRDMLLHLFPGTEVVLTNHQPPLGKRMLSKMVPIVQFGAIIMVVGGDHIFPRLGYVSPPSWYNSLRQNRFGAAAGAWIIGNMLQNMLQSTGAFEVYFDGDLIFSKLKEKRFPDEFELKELIGKTMELREVRLM